MASLPRAISMLNLVQEKVLVFLVSVSLVFGQRGSNVKVQIVVMHFAHCT
jgi:hypothetical protein